MRKVVILAAVLTMLVGCGPKRPWTKSLHKMDAKEDNPKVLRLGLASSLSMTKP